MRTLLWVVLGVTIVAVLVFVGLAAGWAFWGRPLWAAGPFAMPGMMTNLGSDDCPGFGRDTGMMGWGATASAPCDGAGMGAGWASPEGESTAPAAKLTIEEAHEAVEHYVNDLGYASLSVAEVMEFEHNYYAIVVESDSGIGAMELLIDKWSGTVGPEMGPNMMWNERYGMHGAGAASGPDETNTIAPDEALQIAQRWLDTHREGVTLEDHADPFYGYYTIHTMKDATIEGMISVHAETGQVWYHTWHGAFIQMIEEDRHDE